MSFLMSNDSKLQLGGIGPKKWEKFCDSIGDVQWHLNRWGKTHLLTIDPLHDAQIPAKCWPGRSAFGGRIID
jgi:hypothetical protein